MNNSFKYFFSLIIISSAQCFGMMHPASRNENSFQVFDGYQIHNVKPYDVEMPLRKMRVDQLRSFLDKGGKIRATKLNNGDYVVRAHVPGLGGGPIFGAITALVTYTATGIATVGTFAVVTVVTLNPVAGLASGAAVGTAGAGLSAYATAAATVLPTA